ncbi:unnamed protein product [Amaranthus hypochondriacus]
MASLILGITSMASHPISLSFSSSHSVSGVSLSSPSAFSLSTPTTTSPALPLIYCGRGDRKTAKGKRFNHSFGNARPKDKKKGRGPPKSPVVPPVPQGDDEAIED